MKFLASRGLLVALLALLWVLLTNDYDWASFAFGVILASSITFLLYGVYGPRSVSSIEYLKRPFAFSALLTTFFYELVLSAIQISVVLLRPNMEIKPGILDIPLSVRDPVGVTIFANLISLVPGTLSVDLSEDNTILYIHVFDSRDAQGVRRYLKDGFEQRVMRAFGH